MAEREMIMVFCYDISSPKIRRRAAACLEKQAVRVQESVFEARLVKKVADVLFAQVSDLLEDTDSLRMYALSTISLQHTRVAGTGQMPTHSDHWLI